MDILLQIKQQRDLQLQREFTSVERPSFFKALAQEGIRIIGEIKRASPSKGQIALEDFDLLKQAAHYVEQGVAAFSILTEEAYPSSTYTKKRLYLYPFSGSTGQVLRGLGYLADSKNTFR